MVTFFILLKRRYTKNKPLVTHLERRTFVTTIALTKDMNIGVLSKTLGHNSIKVTLDSYRTIIDELMLLNVKELKEKLSPKKQQKNETDNNRLSTTQKGLISMVKNASKN